MRTLLTAVAMSALLALPAVAQTVQVVPMDDAEASGLSSASLSEYVVAGCLGALFDGGLICTNSRTVPGTLAGFAVYWPGPEVRGSYVDFLLLIFASYSGGAGGTVPPACSYRLVRLSDGVELASGVVEAAAPVSKDRVDVEKTCMAMGSDIAGRCLAVW